MFQSKVGTYLEDFLERLQLLPFDLKRSLELVRDLDTDSVALLDEIKELQKAYVSKATRRIKDRVGRGGNLSEIAEDRPGLEELSKKRRHAVQLADERLNHVGQLRDAISYHVRVLDAKLEEFETSLRQSGQFREQPVPSVGAGGGSSVSGRGGKGASARSATPDPTPVHDPPPPSEDIPVPIEANEEVYCYCRRVYFGDMIGCDNDDCAIEWFHFECVNLREQPKGQWFCPDCTKNMKESRSNKRGTRR